MEVRMTENVFIEGRLPEIIPLFAGSERCAPSHKFGPAVREHYIIHFVISGKGSFTDCNGTYNLGAGEMFIIKPGDVTVYQADEREPWEYAWLAFAGEGSEQFVNSPSVMNTPEGIDERLHTLVKSDVSAPEMYLSLIYELVYRLLRSNESDTTPTDRLRRIHRYIKYNYMLPISVTDLARKFGFDRSYLYRIFKERYGIGIKAYITRVRMSKAVELLDSGYTVAEVASMVGYDDPFNFSKAFKKHFGQPPSSFKD